MTEARLLFQSARTALDPPPGAKDRVLHAVRARVAPSPPSSWSMARIGVAATVVAGALYALWPSARLSSSIDAPTETMTPPVAEIPESLPPIPMEIPAPEAVPAPSVAAPPLPVRARPAPSASSSASTDDFLLLSRAAQLRQRDPEAALPLLDEHARRFPATPLAEERQRLRVEALCASGRVAEARPLFDALRSSAPASPHIASLLRACPALAPP